MATTEKTDQVPDGIDAVLDLQLALICGPVADDFSEAQLERGWRVFGAQLTDNLRDHPRPGTRPWGFWAIEVGQEEPEDRIEATVILARMGELTDAEIAKIAARRDPSHPETLELHERVIEALESR